MVNHPKSDKGLLCSSWFKDESRPTTWSSSGRDEERVARGPSLLHMVSLAQRKPRVEEAPSQGV